jgi:hypothetical protein
MVRQRLLSVLGTLALAAPSLAGGNALEYDVQSGLAGIPNTQSVGWQFDVIETITVEALSWTDEDLNGLSHAHETGLWNPAGVLLASVVIPAGTDAGLRGIWRSVAIDPIELAPGKGYIVGGLNNIQSTDRLAANVDLTFVNASIDFRAATFAPINGGFQRPTSISGAVNGFYGPSFQTGDGQPDCFVVTDAQIDCHADGTAFTWTVQGSNTCTGASQMFNFTASGAAVGQQVCFTLVVFDETGGVCCTTDLCIEAPDCSPPAIPADIDGDGAVQVLDLLALLGAWGVCPVAIDPAGGCPADLDGDGMVGIADFLIMLTTWG